MKPLVLCCVVLGVFQVWGAPLNNEQKDKLKAYHQDCLAQSKVNEDIVQQSRKGVISDDPAFKTYLNCFSQKVGFQNADGAVQKEVFEQKIGKNLEDAALLKKLVDQCAVDKENAVETSYYIAKCLRDVAPNLEIFKVDPDVVYLPNEVAQKVSLIHKDCAAQFNFDDQEIENARKHNTIFNDHKYEPYFHCFLKRQGFLNADGQVNKDGFEKNLGRVIDDQAVLDGLVSKCAAQQETPESTSFFVAKCLHENLPIYVELFPKEIPVSDEIAKIILQHGRECIQETGVDRELVQKTREGIFEEDPKLKEFAFCMGKKAGFIDDAGEPQLDVMRQKTGQLLKDPVVVEKLVKECGVKKETPQETAFYASMCFSKNSPGKLSITRFGVLSSAQKEKGQKLIKECSQESRVPKELVLKARKGDFVDDPLLKQYFYCISRKANVLSEEGEFNAETIRKDLTELFNAEEAEKLLEKCSKKHDTPLNTSFESFRCFYNSAPEVAPVF
ncbi:uncharacterized protein LOC143200547 [Rhynchophorus ferrugineus]|uniref:Odorant binding protein n=1 Tax=Rhynchophorus ferrugineus TaxID=354439 RepID=A0A834ID87_RHYFE|nr:hypothetical protein GWI33_008208 [Rhynchophorus ferrugineus]